MAPPPPDDYAGALRYFHRLLPMTADEFDLLGVVAKERGFAMAGVQQLELVVQVWRALDKAIAEGTTLEEFKADVGDKLTNAWGGEKPYRLETTFRTWTQRAYAAGRYEMQVDPAVLEQRPYWEFVAILDSRTSAICSSLNHVVRPALDPFWQTRNPPLHHSCRSTVVSLTEEQAAAKGVTPSPPTGAAPTPGFGGPPTQDFEPDLSDYPAALVDIFNRKMAG